MLVFNYYCSTQTYKGIQVTNKNIGEVCKHFHGRIGFDTVSRMDMFYIPIFRDTIPAIVDIVEVYVGDYIFIAETGLLRVVRKNLFKNNYRLENSLVVNSPSSEAE